MVEVDISLEILELALSITVVLPTIFNIENKYISNRKIRLFKGLYLWKIIF